MNGERCPNCGGDVPEWAADLTDEELAAFMAWLAEECEREPTA